jgi:Flp pilus assembly protein TadD
MNKLTTKILIFLLIMAAVGAGGWFGRKAYKKYTERRFVAKARQYIHNKDANKAAMCLQRALQVNPGSAEASQLVADLLEVPGLPTALSWRIRAAQLAPEKPQYRLEWAKTAIKLQDFASAKAALDVLSQKEKDTLEYHKLAGALAWGLSDNSEARHHYTEALRLEPANLTIALNLATIDLASTNAVIASAGRVRLEELTTNAELRIPALRQLAKEAVGRKSFDSALDYADKVVESPGSTFKDRIDYLQILQASKNPDYSSCLAVLKRDAATNSAQAFVLGEWIASAENPANALLWLKSLPAVIQTNQPVPLVLAECLASVHDWDSLLALLGKQDWGEADYYRFALESYAQVSLKQKVPAKAAWQKALHLAHRRLDRLSRLAQSSTGWGLESEQIDVLREITSDFPKERWAATLLVAEYYKEGNTQAIAEVLANIYAADPSDPNVKNSLANVSLLRKSDLERAHRMAREAYDSAPTNPFFASTYAYSLLLQERPEDAVQVVSQVKTNFLQIPSIAAYYGVVQARSGHKDLAREPLMLAGKAPLLPEEKEIVQLAQSQL